MSQCGADRANKRCSSCFFSDTDMMKEFEKYRHFTAKYAQDICCRQASSTEKINFEKGTVLD